VEGRRTLEAVFELCAAQPAAARLCLVDAYAVGMPALEPMMQAFEELDALSLLNQEGEARRRESLARLVRAVSGAMHQVMYRRLSEGTESELPGCVEETWEWVLGLAPLPGPLRSRARRGAEVAGGPPPFAAHIPSERILRGFAGAVGERGYGATTIAEIATEAKISQATFYAHFSGKEDAMEAALDSSGAQMVAATLPAVRRAPSWKEGVRTAITSICAFLAAEPAFARLRAVEAYAAGPWAVGIRDQASAEILEVTLALDPAAPRLEGIAREATIGALNAVLFDAVQKGEAEELLAVAAVGTYLVLAPLVGSAEAYSISSS
jgi:AcrR family transcriptional regulator